MEKAHKLDIPFWRNSKAFFEHFNQQTQLLTQVFTEVCNAFPQKRLQHFFPNAKGCKVSKGNQLDGFPYQVLDIIRDFDLQHGFNIRFLNWWGNGFYIFITYGSETAKYYQKIIPSHFEGYYLSKAISPYHYENVIKESEILSTENFSSEIRASNHFQIWKKLNISEDLTVTRNSLEKMIQGILDIHT